MTVLFSDVMNTFLALLAPTSLLLIGAYFVGQGFTVGTLVAAYGYWKTASGPISAILNNITALYTSFASMDRIFEFFRETPSVKDRPGAKPLNITDGKIELHDVTFHYPLDEDTTVLNQLSFTVPAKRSLALVGESGAGKSTISQLLLRFYDPVRGEIAIDGQDLRNVTQESLREQIGFVMQETILLSGTIRENLQFAKPDATTDEMVNALQNAGAWDFVRLLPQGLDTMLGERGARLSTGQKQRLSIARVFLKNPPIVIFDEATSALDAVTEKQIQQSMSRLLHDRTAIIIAHRLSTVIDCDEILFLAGGRIVAHGPHKQLLTICPQYHDLCQKQLIVTAQE
ncbi:MAG TPA: ABC transporter ATP-binding protein, partial [Armatimonadota bacterium]|nr:ABC transporter ATP-binding protein [Armatimonadota bacterium]